MKRGRSLEAELALGQTLASIASEVALAFFNRGLTTEVKDDGTPVTIADREIERLLIETLAKERPGDSVFGEESGIHGSSPWQWIIDPIDGTSHFARGEHEWGTHVALQCEGEVVVGIITRPTREQRWWAVKGGGAFRGSGGSPDAISRLRVSKVTDLSESRVSYWSLTPTPARSRLETASVFVTPSLDDILRLAEGQLEAVIDLIGKPWDHAPAVVIVEEAGGRFQDAAGGRRIDQGEGRYTNGLVDRDLLVALSE